MGPDDEFIIRAVRIILWSYTAVGLLAFLGSLAFWWPPLLVFGCCMVAAAILITTLGRWVRQAEQTT